MQSFQSMEAPAVAPRSHLALKALLLLLALLLPGGSLLLLALATWRGVKASRTEGFAAGFREELRLLRGAPRPPSRKLVA